MPNIVPLSDLRNSKNVLGQVKYDRIVCLKKGSRRSCHNGYDEGTYEFFQS